MMKKWFSLFIASIFVFMFAVSPAMGEIVPVEEAVARIEEMELERAAAYGLVTEEWLAMPDDWVTYPEFCTMLSRLIELVDAEKTAEWEQLAQLGLVAEDIMHRDDAALALYLAAQTLGIDYYNIETYPDQQRVAANHSSHLYDHDFPLWPQEALGGQAPWVYAVGTAIYGPMPESEYAMQTAFWFSLLRRSLVTEMPLLTWSEDYDLRMNEGITRRDAALAAVRLLESEANLLDENHYIHINEVGNYDRNIITDELLSAPSELPEPVVDGKLTDKWNGAGLSSRKSGVIYKDFQESDIAFLADNGFNFTRIFYGFDTLRYPNNPEDIMMVNEDELRDLDQLIAWGIEYGVHIQLGLFNTPNGRNDSLDFSDEEWEQISTYWTALARRYAYIPSKYLSFDLFNEMEPSPDQMTRALEKIDEFAQDMRAYNSDRLIFLSFSSTFPNLEWVEGIASIGVSLGCHAYNPFPMFCGFVAEETDTYAIEEDVAYWPYPYFPRILDAGEEYTIEGEIGARTLIMEFSYSHDLRVTFDNGDSVLLGIPDDRKGNSHYLELDIPQGVSKITISVENADCVEFNDLIIGNDRLFAHDLIIMPYEGSANLVWTEAERWTSEKYYTGHDIFEDSVRASLNIAQEYGVHLIVNEFGYFGGEATIEAVAGYTQALVQAFEDHGISWCFCETEGWPYRYISLPFDTGYELEGATIETAHYIFDDGHARKVQYCKEMVEAFHGEYLDTDAVPLSKVYTDKETVKAVQTALNGAGFACGTPDGVAGKKTVAALTDYQTAKGLTVTGTITHETLISMGLAD